MRGTKEIDTKTYVEGMTAFIEKHNPGMNVIQAIPEHEIVSAYTVDDLSRVVIHIFRARNIPGMAPTKVLKVDTEVLWTEGLNVRESEKRNTAIRMAASKVVESFLEDQERARKAQGIPTAVETGLILLAISYLRSEIVRDAGQGNYDVMPHRVVRLSVDDVKGVVQKAKHALELYSSDEDFLVNKIVQFLKGMGLAVPSD
jgi:hypothetical protein